MRELKNKSGYHFGILTKYTRFCKRAGFGNRWNSGRDSPAAHQAADVNYHRRFSIVFTEEIHLDEKVNQILQAWKGS